LRTVACTFLLGVIAAVAVLQPSSPALGAPISITDSFSGTQLNTSIWSDAATGKWAVSQNDHLTMAGVETVYAWGTNGFLGSVITFYPHAPIDVQVDISVAGTGSGYHASVALYGLAAGTYWGVVAPIYDPAASNDTQARFSSTQNGHNKYSGNLVAPPLVHGKTHTYRLAWDGENEAGVFMDGQHLGDFPLDLGSGPVGVWLQTSARLPGDTAIGELDNFSVIGVPWSSVGGIADVPAAARAPEQATDASDGGAVVVGGAAWAVVVGGAAWYARRRRGV